MRQIQITSLAVCGLALTALTATGALGQVARADQNGNIPPLALYPQQGAIASDVGTQLFRFGVLSNKSGDPNCMAGSRTNKARPKVVATFPANGAVVRPGLVVVRVTFDQPMSCDASFEGTSDLPNPCPGRWREATVSQDRRSFRTVCEVRPNTRYRLTLHSFRNSHGMAIPADVAFSTSGSAPIASIRQALAEDVGGDVTG